MAADGETIGRWQVGSQPKTSRAESTFDADKFDLSAEETNQFNELNLKILMGEDRQGYLMLVAEALAKSDYVENALKKKDSQLVDKLGNCEKITDPSDSEYLEALGLKTTDEEQAERVPIDFKGKTDYYARKLLDVILGSRLLAVVLILTAIAAFCTVYQIAADKTVVAFEVIEL
jgi:hypothetical protein